MAILVIAEHDNASIKSGTLNTVTAAKKIGGDIHILVAGANAAAAAAAAAKIDGVSKVLLADGANLAHPLAENVAPVVVEVSKPVATAMCWHLQPPQVKTCCHAWQHC